jgi:hypothetical protein
VHALPSSQETPAWEQTPPMHASVVQASPSSHSASLRHGIGSQLPVVGSHCSPGEHTFGSFVQPVAESHESLVQAFPSSQLIPWFEHPETGSQESLVQAL